MGTVFSWNNIVSMVVIVLLIVAYGSINVSSTNVVPKHEKVLY